MSLRSLARSFAQQLDFASESEAPLDIEGARAEHGVYEKKFADFQNLFENPGFSVKDIVCPPYFS